MTEALQTRAQKIVGRIKHVLSGPSNRSIISFNPPNPLSEMYDIANQEIQANIDRKKEALEAKKRLKIEEARANTLRTGAVKKLALRSAQKDRRDIFQKINLAKQGGGAFDPKYASTMASWDAQLQKAEEIIAKLSKE